MYWKTSQKRKVHQRAINKIVRNLNQTIEQDELWKGRYCVRQYKSWWISYQEEPTYHFLCTQFIFYDKKTNKTFVTDIKSVNTWMFLHGFKLWQAMNDFIINSGVWEEDPRPTRENTQNFRKIVI